jgi:hypothetical protein
VIFDDWCQPHCPGVGMAVWEDYLRGDLIPRRLPTPSSMRNGTLAASPSRPYTIGSPASPGLTARRRSG